MRRNRIILLILWILTLVGISFYGGPISYGFFIVISLIPIVSILYILCVIWQFRIYQKLDSRNLVSNRTSVFYFTLQNESLITFAGIRVFFYSTFSTISGLEDSIEYELAPHTGIKKQTELVCKYRGEYEVGIKKIIAQDFFRLFTIAYKNREPMRVNVKPNIVTLPHLQAEQTASAAKNASTNRNEPDVLVRDYVPGDDRRMIHWKATAAMQKLMVRERTDEQQKGVGIIMTPKRSSRIEAEYIPAENKILEAVIALALFFNTRNIPVTVWYYTTHLHESVIRGREEFEHFYEQMSDYSFDTDRESALMYEEILRHGAAFDCREVFMVTDRFEAGSSAFVKELSRNGLFATVYLITDKDAKDTLSEQIPRCNLIAIRTDADLTEVM